MSRSHNYNFSFGANSIRRNAKICKSEEKTILGTQLLLYTGVERNNNFY